MLKAVIPPTPPRELTVPDGEDVTAVAYLLWRYGTDALPDLLGELAKLHWGRRQQGLGDAIERAADDLRNALRELAAGKGR